ncbi:MAG: glycosyltransferase [bacterium]|nr:glycosyltransferase [bacterium]
MASLTDLLTGDILELGGGDNPTYHPNVDVRPGKNVDIIADLNKPLPVKDGTYDGVFCKYAIEHIGWRSLDSFVKEIARVLKVGGMAVVVTANLKEQARVIATREWGDAKDPWFESRLVFGDQDYPENTHRAGLSPELATKLFNAAGLQVQVLAVDGTPTDMVIIARKPAKDRFMWIREQIPVNAYTVDIGCSDAPVTWNIPNVTYVDSEPYEKLASDCRTLGRTPFPKERFVQVDVGKGLPFTDGQFEVVLATEIFEHVDDPVALLREVARVGRKIVITIPNEYDWDEKWKPFQNPTHVRHYTRKQVEGQLREAGYTGAKLDRLDYEGWSFWTVLYDSPVVKAQTLPSTPAACSVSRPAVTKLKIGLLSTPFMTVPPSGYGGLERIVYDLACGLRDRGHEITVFAPNGSKIDGCRVVFTGSPVSTTKTDWLAEETRVFETVKGVVKGLDILHGHNWFGLEYRLKDQVRGVLHTHHGGLNTEWWKPNPPIKLNLVAISDWMKRVYAGQGHTAEFVYNGVDLEKYGLYTGKRNGRLVFVGRIDKFKQPHVAIEVAKKTGMGLDVIGGTFVQDEKYLDEIIRMCDGTQIKFWRDPPQSDKVKLMQEASCLLFPSKMGEPFGLVAAESMACGTPVIALNDGAIPELIENGKSGYVVNTPDEMVKAVALIGSGNPEACRTQAEKFGRDVMAKGYEELYRRVLEGREW